MAEQILHWPINFNYIKVMKYAFAISLLVFIQISFPWHTRHCPFKDRSDLTCPGLEPGKSQWELYPSDTLQHKNKINHQSFKKKLFERISNYSQCKITRLQELYIYQTDCLIILKKDWQSQLQFSESNNYYKERIKALEQVQQQGNYLFYKNFDLSSRIKQALGLIKADLSLYSGNYGNALQHQAHTEIINILDQAGSKTFACSNETRALLPVLVESLDIARNCNQNGAVIQSFNLIDCAYQLLDGINVLATGIGNGLKQTISPSSLAFMGVSAAVAPLVGPQIMAGGVALLIASTCADLYSSCGGFDGIRDNIVKRWHNDRRNLIQNSIAGATELAVSYQIGKFLTKFSGLANREKLTNTTSKIFSSIAESVDKTLQFSKTYGSEVLKKSLLKLQYAKNELSTKSLPDLTREIIESSLFKPNNKIIPDLSHPIFDSPRVGSALKTDLYHAFNNIIDNNVRFAKPFKLIDDATRKNPDIKKILYQIEGSLEGRDGIFEWIIAEQAGKSVVSHRRFIEHATITGIPNQG